MAGGIADGKKDQLLFAPCLLKSGFTPGIPIDGIMRVQLQVRALLVDEPVRVREGRLFRDWSPKPRQGRQGDEKAYDTAPLDVLKIHQRDYIAPLLS